MTLSVSPTDSAIMKSLGDFLTAILPSDCEVIQGQINKVAEPHADDFAVFTMLRRTRLETNVDSYVDCMFTGSITGKIMTVTNVSYGVLQVGSNIFGVDVLPNNEVAEILSGSGAVGSYRLTLPNSLGSRTLAAGVFNAMQPTQFGIQIDVHGPNSGANAQRISTLFRDEFAVSNFIEGGGAAVPLYADNPTQAPFINGEDQYEYRWVVAAEIQANQAVIDVPQQFADQVLLGLISVDAVYPDPD